MQRTTIALVLAAARHGIRNGALESGMLVPVTDQFTDKLSLTTVLDSDSLKDADGLGHHFNTSQLVNIGYALRTT